MPLNRKIFFVLLKKPLAALYFLATLFASYLSYLLTPVHLRLPFACAS